MIIPTNDYTNTTRPSIVTNLEKFTFIIFSCKKSGRSTSLTDFLHAAGLNTSPRHCFHNFWGSNSHCNHIKMTTYFKNFVGLCTMKIWKYEDMEITAAEERWHFPDLKTHWQEKILPKNQERMTWWLKEESKKGRVT